MTLGFYADRKPEKMYHFTCKATGSFQVSQGSDRQAHAVVAVVYIVSRVSGVAGKNPALQTTL